MYTTLIDSFNTLHAGYIVSNYPVVSAPNRLIETVQIPYHNGKLTIDRHVFDDVTVIVEYTFIEKSMYKVNEAYRKLKAVLLNAAGKTLRLSDDVGFFYKIKKCVITTSERTARHVGKVKAEFTLDPFTYLESGLNEITNYSAIFNEYDTSNPVYRIIGEGVCTLTVNGKEVIANVGQNLTIDTELQLSYREDGILQNTSITGDYDDLKLIKGLNTITVSDGFRMSVIPNWRMI